MSQVLDNLHELEEINSIPNVEIYVDDDCQFGIDIDGKCWSNCLRFYQAEDQIYNLNKGYELGRLSMKGKMSW